MVTGDRASVAQRIAERVPATLELVGASLAVALVAALPLGILSAVRRGGWWYHTDIDTKKRWYGEPWGGPDTHEARAVTRKSKDGRIARMTGTTSPDSSATAMPMCMCAWSRTRSRASLC